MALLSLKVTAAASVAGSQVGTAQVRSVNVTGPATTGLVLNPGVVGPTGAQGPTGPVGPPGIGANWRGTWSSGTTYAIGDGVGRLGVNYVSVTAGNINHDPSTDVTFANWTPLLTVNSYLLPSGSDDSARLQALISANCDITLGPGTFLWNTAPILLPRSAVGIRIRGSGIGVTTIKLSSGAPRAFDFNKIADGDIFQNIEIRDLAVDDNNTGGKNHLVIGNYMAGSEWSHFHLDRITVTNVEVINVPSPDSASTHHPQGCFLLVNAITQKGTGTQYNITNIRFENYRQTGGHNAISVVGGETFGYSGDGSVNVFLDNIQLINCYHDSTLISTSALANNFQIGSRGFGDRVLVERCTGLNGCDEGLEINGMSTITVRDSVFTDALNVNFLNTNFATPSNPERQILVLDNVETRNTVRPSATFGFVVGTLGNLPHGIVHVRDCTYVNTTADALTVSGQALRISLVAFDHVLLDGFSAIYTAAAPSSAGTVNAFPVRIATVTSAGKISVRDSQLKLTSTKSGAGTCFVFGLACGGVANTEIDVDGWTLNISNTLSAGTMVATALNLGGSIAWTGGGAVRRVTPIYTGVSTGQPSNIAVQVGSSWTPAGLLNIEDCNFTGLPTGATEISNATAGNSASIRAHGNKYKTAPIPSTLTGITTATGATTGKVFSCLATFTQGSGAGITAIDYSTDAGGHFTNFLTQAAGALPAGFDQTLGPLTPDAQIKVTFTTTQPTINLVPVDP